jgi:hypothetical protein
MNERIRELAKQSDPEYTGIEDDDFGHALVGDEAIKKFALLIVRECISTLEETIYRPIDHEGDEVWIDLLLKEHFGVEL